MSTLFRESLEAKLASLESKRIEALTEPVAVCASCYELQEDCVCQDPVMWPLAAVLYKLRAELAVG